MQWFVNLMEELGIECLVGHPAELGELAGDLVLGVLNVFAEGQERKKLVAAGNAAEGRDAERTPEGAPKPSASSGEMRLTSMLPQMEQCAESKLAKGVARDRKRVEQREQRHGI